MKKNHELIAAVQSALQKLNKDGIRGWGLNMLYLDGAEFGELVKVGAEHGCSSETCRHSSHDPADAIYKWIPPEGYTLHILGEDGEYSFFYITSDTEEYIVVRIEGGHYHDRLQWAEFEDVPEWMLARLAE